MPEQLKIQFINKANQLNLVTDAIEADKEFALDLEFIPERSYIPQLCLIQVATRSNLFIIDPFSIPDLVPLWDLVSNESIEVVFHAAEQDVLLIYQESGRIPANLFDAQIAAGFIGLGYPLSYGKLVFDLLGMRLTKTESFTDWSQRPLSNEQVEYAANDVRYLLAVKDRLKKKLESKKRLDWAKDECAKFTNPSRYMNDQESAFLKVKGSGSLSRRNLAVLKFIYQLRESRAQRVNKPTRALISDNLLIEIAKRAPERIQDLHKIRGFRNDQINDLGSDLIAAINKGKAIKESDCPLLPTLSIPDKEDTVLSDVLYLLLKLKSNQIGIAPELVAVRNSINQLVRYYRNNDRQSLLELDIMKGWRHENVGNLLEHFLDGKKLELFLCEEGNVSVSFDDHVIR